MGFPIGRFLCPVCGSIYIYSEVRIAEMRNSAPFVLELVCGHHGNGECVMPYDARK